MPHPRPILIVALIVTLIFSSAPAAIRSVQLDTISLGIVRLVLASFAMTIMSIGQRKLAISKLRHWSAQTWKVMLLVGLAFGGHWIFFFLSIKLGGAAIGAIGFSTYGLQLLLFGWLLGYSKVTTLDILGLFLAICGTLLLIPAFTLGNRQTIGLAAGILSGSMAACLPLLHQKHVAIDVQLRTWGQFVIALGLFCCFWPYARWEFRAQDTLAILYLGLVVAWIGHGLWIRISTALSTTTLAILTYLYLPMSLIVSFLILGEKLSGRMLLGTLFVLAANAMVLWHQIRSRTLHVDLPEPL
jgi:drug/metabolite transporter (DMT)-like permease